MVTEEARRLATWGDRHRALIARLTLVLIATLLVDAIGTALIYAFEHDPHKGDIHNVFDAFFFTTVQLLTVSSQIRNPLTTAGRIVDIFLELWAVIAVAGSAGAIATFFQAADPSSRA